MANTLPTNFDLSTGASGAFLGSKRINLGFVSGSNSDVSTQVVAYRGGNALYGAKRLAIPVNGLRTYVNANINASYPGSGSTWFDIKSEIGSTDVTDRDLTLDASPTFVTGTPNYFDFTDGTDAAQYKPGGTLSTLVPAGNVYEVILFAAWHNSTGNYRTIIREASGVSAGDFFLTDTGTNNLGTYDSGFNSLGVNIVSDLPNYDTQFNYQVFSIDTNDNPAVEYYLNDNSTALGTIATKNLQSGPAIFGNQETGGQPGANISAILVYDRRLTATERADIYTVLSDEMGL